MNDNHRRTEAMARVSKCLLFLLMAASAGCDSAEHQAAADAPQGTAVAAEQHQADHDAEHAHQDQEALPLLPIMMRMSADMAGLMQALWLGDYEEMTRHASGISAHPNISTDELARIESILGPEMGAFEAADAMVHEASVRMRDAAKSADMDAFLEQLATVQQGCVGCHSRFRERLRTNR
jgi:hypothetical protein